MISTMVELVGFAVLAGTVWSWNHIAGGAVAGGELLLIGYTLEGTRLDLHGLTARVRADRQRRRHLRMVKRQQRPPKRAKAA